MKVSFITTCRADYLVIYDPQILGKEAVRVKLITDRAKDYPIEVIDDNFTQTLIKIDAKKIDRVHRETVDDIFD